MTIITMSGAATARIKRKKEEVLSSSKTLQDNPIIESYRKRGRCTKPRTGQIQ
jgi:hypothetical protein